MRTALALRFTRSTLLTASVAAWFAPHAAGADLTASSTFPQVTFDDTNGGGEVWHLRGNDGAFNLRDEVNDSSPFIVEPGAASSSLYISPVENAIDANVGIGSAPGNGVTLHLYRASQPTLRFTHLLNSVHNWDIGGDRDRWFVRDETGGTTPFNISTGAPNNSFNIGPLGDVGLGTELPQFPLHVVGEEDAARIAFFDQSRQNKVAAVGFRNNAPVSANNFCGFDFLLRDSAGSRLVSRFNCNLPVTNSATATGAFGIDVLNEGALNRALSIRGNRVSIATVASTHLLRVLNATCNGATWNNACSRELKQNITPLPADDAKAALAALAPVTYAYKANPADPRVGFVAEEVPELVAMPDRQSLSSMDIVAVLTRVTQEQEREIDALRERMAAQEQAHQQALSAVLARLAALESQQAPLSLTAAGR